MCADQPLAAWGGFRRRRPSSPRRRRWSRHPAPTCLWRGAQTPSGRSSWMEIQRQRARGLWAGLSGAESAPPFVGTLGPIPKVAAWPRGSWGVSGLVGPVGYDAPSSGSRSDSGVSQPWDDRVWAGSASAHFEFSLPAGESVRPSCRAF